MNKYAFAVAAFILAAGAAIGRSPVVPAIATAAVESKLDTIAPVALRQKAPALAAQTVDCAV